MAFVASGSLLFSMLFSIMHAVTVYNETYEEYFAKHDRLLTRVLSGYRKDVPPVNVRGHLLEAVRLTLKFGFAINSFQPVFISAQVAEAGRYMQVMSDPMTVNITLMYAKLLAVNEPEQTVDMIIEYDLYWKDPRLKWNPLEYDNIKGLVVNRELVWRVDLLPYDSQSVLDARNEDVQHVYISSGGVVEYYVSYVVSFVCPIDVRKFPFDRQKCELNIASYTFFSNELRIMANTFRNYNGSDTGNGEWSVDRLTAESSSLLSIASNHTFDVATFTFYLQRSSTFYVILIIIPSFVLTFLCVLGLFWSEFNQRDYLEKLGLGFAAILAMCMVLEIAEESVPKTKQLASLSVYILVNLILVTVAISVVVMASKSCGLKSLEDFVSDKWLARYGIKFCTNFRVLCLVMFPLGSIINLIVLIINV